MNDLFRPTKLCKILTFFKPFLRLYIKKLIKKVDNKKRYMSYFVHEYLDENKFNVVALIVILKWIKHSIDFTKKLDSRETNPLSCKLLNERTVFFISGLPRSGTSFLNEYLAIDKSNRTIEYPDLGKDIKKDLDQYDLLFQDVSSIIGSLHPLDVIAEDIEVMSLWTMPHPLIRLYDMESWSGVPEESVFISFSYGQLRYFMEKMTSTEDNKRFLFKSPFIHIVYYNEFKKAFPNHQIILCCRSIIPVALSWCQLYEAALQANYCPIEVDPKVAGKVIMRLICLYEANLSQALSEGRIEVVSFDEMIANPVKEVKRLYSKFSWDWTDSLEKKYQVDTEIQKRKHTARIEKKPMEYYGLDRDLLERIDLSIAESIKSNGSVRPL